jgi:hypothetical protein
MRKKGRRLTRAQRELLEYRYNNAWKRSFKKPVVHELKAWPEFYELVTVGEKTAELRKNDRDFHRGDQLLLREWCPKTGRYTGHECLVNISGVLTSSPGMRRGFCLISMYLPVSPYRFNANSAGKRG